MASGVGTATINWGAFPGANEASVTVTGQTGITGTSHAEAWYMSEVLGSKTANDHAYMATLSELSCGNIVAGTGFTIYGRSTEKLQGSFTVHWVWST
jgi:hypothetical protein